jgi:hypothetical protein
MEGAETGVIFPRVAQLHALGHQVDDIDAGLNFLNRRHIEIINGAVEYSLKQT